MKNPDDSNRNKARKRDPDLVAAESAMKRAALKARGRAGRIGAGVVIMKNGQIVEELQDPPQT